MAKHEDGSAGRRDTARLRAVQTLYEIELSGGDPDTVIGQTLAAPLREEGDEGDGGEPDRDLLRDLVKGVAGEADSLDDMLSAVLADDWPVERLETLLRVILRAGAYELAYRADIPPRATITQYVNLTRAFFDGKQPGLANGVLDQLAKTLRPEELTPQGNGPATD